MGAAQIETFEVTGEWGRAPALDYGGRGLLLILAHGAGAGQAHPFMVARAEALAARGVRVVTFDFPYMALGKRAPDRAPKLEQCFKAVVAATLAHTRRTHAVIGGKSMGGRIASHLASHEQASVRGLVVLGYPLQAPSGALRVSHLEALRVPSLFVQGERDSFGGPEQLRAHLPTSATVLPVARADHSFDVRKKDGRLAKEVSAQIDDAVSAFVLGLG